MNSRIFCEVSIKPDYLIIYIFLCRRVFSLCGSQNQNQNQKNILKQHFITTIIFKLAFKRSSSYSKNTFNHVNKVSLSVVSRGQSRSVPASNGMLLSVLARPLHPCVCIIFPWRYRDIGCQQGKNAGLQQSRFSVLRVTKHTWIFMTSKSRLHSKGTRWVQPSAAPETALFSSNMSANSTANS